MDAVSGIAAPVRLPSILHREAPLCHASVLGMLRFDAQRDGLQDDAPSSLQGPKAASSQWFATDINQDAKHRFCCNRDQHTVFKTDCGKTLASPGRW